MTFLQLALCALLAYLLGNIQTGLIIGRLANVDLRKHGSGSSGATNALRVMGRAQGALTLLGDALKGVLAVCIGLIICGRHGALISGLFVIVGHIWPALFGFHGGKGVATALGALLVIDPLSALCILIVAVIAIALTRMVSVGSMVAALLYLFIVLFRYIPTGDVFEIVCGVLMAGLIFFSHRQNIGRILKGNENTLSASMFKKKGE